MSGLTFVWTLAALLGAGLAAAGIALLRARRGLARVRGVVERLPTTERVPRLTSDSRGELGRLEQSIDGLAARTTDWYHSSRENQGMREAILAAMNEGVVALDRDQRFLLANQAGRAMLGLQSVEVAERKLWELVRIPEIARSVAECLRSGVRVKSEVRVDRGARPRIFDLQVTPLTGAVGGCFFVLYEITEQRRLEDVRRQFVANVSHELKTPLTSMRGYVEAVIEEPSLAREQQLDFLSKAVKSTDRLERIVMDLLSLARLESDSTTLERGRVDLAELCEELLRDFEEPAQRRGIRLCFENEASRPIVDADHSVLETAVSNLVSNALHYSPEGATVVVRLRSDEQELQIDVVDDGPGIAPLEQGRIFERFYRVDKHRSSQVGGTGLGLSIVRRAVGAHGGSVSVESALGRGSTFRIRLPRGHGSGPENGPDAPAGFTSS